MSTSTMQIRFQKVDQYKNSIFIAGTKKLSEKDAFDRLSLIYDKLKGTVPTFLPIYATADYTTIRFKPNTKFKFDEGCLYEVEFAVRKKEYKDQDYISCFVNKSKLVKKADVVDQGELLTLE